MLGVDRERLLAPPVPEESRTPHTYPNNTSICTRALISSSLIDCLKRATSSIVMTCSRSGVWMRPSSSLSNLVKSKSIMVRPEQVWCLTALVSKSLHSERVSSHSFAFLVGEALLSRPPRPGDRDCRPFPETAGACCVSATARLHDYLSASIVD